MPLSTNTLGVLWTLHKGDDRLNCSVEFLPQGLQVYLAINDGTPYASHTFQTQDELLQWTARKHGRCLTEGWT